MKVYITLLVALVPFFADAKWDCYEYAGKPNMAQLVVYRSRDDVTYRYMYNYRDSTFRIQMIPSAAVLAWLKNKLDRYPFRPAYVEVLFRFKGGEEGKRNLMLRIENPSPDSGEIVRKGYIETVIRDKDGELLYNLQHSKKMGIRYWDFLVGYHRTINLSTKDFCKFCK